MQLKGALEQLVFKDFLHQYDFPKGLNPTHIKTLMSLYIHGSAPMSELSRMLNLEKGSFTPVANKLIKEEFIKKERNQTDKRIYELMLTEKGEKIAKEFSTAHRKYLTDLVKQVEDLDGFLEAINTVTNSLEQIPGVRHHPQDFPPRIYRTVP